MDLNSSGGSDRDFDPRVVKLTNALEQEAIGLLHNKPLDTSKVSAVLTEFPNKTDQVEAMAAAVNKLNPLHHEKDPNIPLLQGIHQPETGGDWLGAVNIYTQVPDGPTQKHYPETLYVLPLGDPIDKASSGDQTGKQTQPESGSSEPVEQGKLVPGMNLGSGS